MDQRKRKFRTSLFIGLFITYMFYVISACTDENGVLSINSVLSRLSARLQRPFFICYNQYTFSFIGFGMLAGLYFGMYYYYTKKEIMDSNEFGSAKWGDANEITRRLTKLKKGIKREDAPYERVFSKNLRMNMSETLTQRNNNMLLVAGPGKGKTFRLIKPNILRCCGSMIICDPKKEILRDTGNFLKNEGYDIKVIDLIDFDRSDHYNPMLHIPDADNIPELIETLWNSMEDEDAKKGEQVWDDAAKSLVEGFMFYIFMELEEEKRTFRTLCELVNNMCSSDKGIKNMVKTMQALAENSPGHPAANKFLKAMTGAENTFKSVMFCAGAKISKLENEKLLKIFDKDNIDFVGMGTKKPTALFICVRDGETRWNFVVSIAFMQAFDELIYAADHYFEDRNGKLPIPVSCFIDEFANVPLPKRFPKLLSIMRGRNINTIITLQDFAQLKKLYAEDEGTIAGDCSVHIYMGGNSDATQERISKRLGKQTAYKVNTSKSYGVHGSESNTVESYARDLMTPDEVARLDTDEMIVFIEGEDPVKDKKYETQFDKNFLKAMSLGFYRHKPERYDISESGEPVLSQTKIEDNGITMEAISLEEKERLVNEGAKVTHIDAGGDEKKEKPKKNKETNLLKGYSDEQKAVMKEAYEKGLLSYKEMTALLPVSLSPEKMKIILGSWKKVPVSNKV